MNNILGMQIVHALGHLSANVNQRIQFEFRLVHMYMFVQTAALTPLCDNGEWWFADAAHEQQNIAVSGFLQHGHLVFEGL